MKRKTTPKKTSKIGVIERWDKPFEYFGFLNLVLMAFYYGSLWFSATPSDVDKVFKFSILMAFEFIMVHSGVMMAMFPARISLFVFFPFYGLFALVFQMMIGFSDWTIASLYCITVFNRMRFAFFNTSQEIRQRVIGQSVFAVTVYFFLVMFVAFGENLVPEFALNEAFRQSESYLDAKKHGGLFADFPHTAIALGTLYFSFLALFDLSLIRMRK